MQHNQRPLVVSIAGSDSSGLAGIQMDIRTCSALKVHCATVMTANTVQDNYGVGSVNPVDASVFQQQLESVLSLQPDAIKIGLIGSAEQVVIMKQCLSTVSCPIVFDPVFASSSGHVFIDDDLQALIEHDLLPLCTLVMPNLEEAARLAHMSVDSIADVELAADILLHHEVKNLLIKGGHGASHLSQDYFASLEKSFWLTNKRIETINHRGTGCALSAATAAALALHYPLYDAVVIGKMAIQQALSYGYSLATDKGPVSLQHFPNKQLHLPCLTQTADFNFRQPAFPECATTPLGLYPVVDSYEWLQRLLPLGITTAQLRIKDKQGDDLENEIQQSIQLAKQHNCRLFINDYWSLAIKYEAYGVHLGQEDLDDADIDAIRKAGLRLGISTHCHYEVARAHSFKPSYIACGPVYHTNTKQMPWVPQAIAGLNYWQQTLHYPLVAIGGINQERIDAVAETGVSGIAMITAITLAEDPEQTASRFMQQITNRQSSQDNE
ncbi:thiamine phosphate synthase [Pleionea sp. CnH1-48]|uniref:thiamine phosphate synthase n=1 Tax=Pleionea sp. CnH1-48 TaxID=2954494 RepID=UPI00209817D7|nr:thiamine phosphate synthase [Pleionea sp. CnH1-48]MCO7223870.1 thiamine phosphate synthase [Pleionea sp. CnH1-48]